MSIINEMIRNGGRQSSIGWDTFDDDDPDTRYLLGTINRNQRRRWYERDTIPSQVLMAFWEWGIRVDKNPPATGMGVGRFLELLWKFYQNCPDLTTRDAALHLYTDTVKSELMPKVLPKKEKYLKGPKGKWIPVSHIRTIPDSTLNK